MLLVRIMAVILQPLHVARSLAVVRSALAARLPHVRRPTEKLDASSVAVPDFAFSACSSARR
jgi:hypothetical protein